jgi:thioredoxin-related protein
MSRSSRFWEQSGFVLWLLATMLYFSAAPCLAKRAPTSKANPAASQKGLEERYDPRRDPEGDLAAASAEAKPSNKNIFVVVGGEWCSWCHTFERFLGEHPNLAALLERNYVLMKVNMSQENPNRVFLSRFPYIHGYPHIFIMDADGKLIRSQSTNVLEDGKSYNAERFKKFLEQFAPKSSS